MRNAHAADLTYSINCGGGASGSFSADGYASGGTKYTTTAAFVNPSNVQDAPPQDVYLTERYGMNFSYTFSGLTAGAYYPVRLHFAEYKYDAAGKRTFSVSINGQTALSGYDVFAAAGNKYKAVAQTFVTTADSSGKIKIAFTGGSDNAEIKGIEIFGALKLTSPDPMSHPENGDVKNHYVYDTTSPDGVIYIPGTVSSTGAPQSVMRYLINSQNFDIGITPALPNLLDHTLAVSGNIISVQTTGTDTAGNSIQANNFVANKLPANNGDFGNHNVLTTGGAGSQSANIRTFFSRDSINWPNNDGVTPNWYYYWSQTSAFYGTVEYTPGDRSYTQYETLRGKWVAHISDDAKNSAGAGCWGYAQGIDYFANICRHENQHRVDLEGLWGGPVILQYDQDGDSLPDDYESSLIPGHPYDNTKRATYPDTFAYGENPLPDAEDYCLMREPAWTAGSADKQDWASPGHQDR